MYKCRFIGLTKVDVVVEPFGSSWIVKSRKLTVLVGGSTFHSRMPKRMTVVICFVNLYISMPAGRRAESQIWMASSIRRAYRRSTGL